MLKPCPECNNPCAADAAACPKCGKPLIGLTPPKSASKRESPGILGYAIGCFGLIVLAGLFTALGSNDDSKPYHPPSDYAATEQAAVRVSAPALCAAYHRNGIDAAKTYEGVGRITILGTVESVSRDIVGEPYVMLSGGESAWGVQCMFAREIASRLGSLSPGDKVAVTGECEGSALGLSIIVRECDFSRR